MTATAGSGARSPGRSRATGIVYGVQPVRELLAAGAAIHRVLLAPGARGPALKTLEAAARRQRVNVVSSSRAELDRLAAGGNHQGVVAFAASATYSGRDAVLAAIEPPAFVTVLDQIEDPRNLGAILRTAAATDADAVFLPVRRAAGLSPGAVKASAGTVGRVPVVRETNMARLLDILRDRGIWTVAVEPDGSPVWGGFDLTLPVALVMGSEGKGVRPLVRRHCDAAVGLPLCRGVGSLNVAVAFGALAYELRRQRDAPTDPPGSGQCTGHVRG